MQEPPFRQRSWTEKFGDAFRGLKAGVRGESSFFVHFFFTAAVIAAAAVLRIDSAAEWCLLLLCITIVLAAEMFNTALESLARAITSKVDPHVGRALNVGSAAVLLAALGAVIVGLIIFLNRLGLLLGRW